jgi:serine/threonine protein kinase
MVFLYPKTRLPCHGPLPPARAVHVLRQVCGAHAIGLIHRDIKPGNIIVGERGGLPDVAKLLDFGLVRGPGLDGAGQKLTLTGAVVGTPAVTFPGRPRTGAGSARSADERPAAAAVSCRWLSERRVP